MKALFHTIIARLHGFFRSRSLESDFNQELEEHLAMSVEDKIRRGMSPEEARRKARVELGGLTQLREAGREARGLPWLDSFGLDIRLGLRMMRKNWGLTLIGGIAMAVAISIGATAFAIGDSAQESVLPLDEGGRVVRLVTRGRTRGFTTSQDFEWWQKTLQSVKEISAFAMVERLLVNDQNSAGRRVAVAQMTAGGFRVARVRPVVGRPLLEEDERQGAPPVAVIGYDIWQSFFSGDHAAIGQTVQLGGIDHVVVGVMPEGFAFPLNHSAWIPFRRNPLTDARPANADVVVFGRLAPAATIESAEAELAVVGPAPDSENDEETRLRVVPYADAFLLLPPLYDLLPLLMALLLIPPCANIAILIYARNVSREEEFAARYVLGAGRGRIVGQLFIEAFVLAAAAGGVGLLLADQFAQQFRRAVGAAFPYWMSPHISLETVLYVAGLAAFAAMIAGVLPALRATGRMRQSGFQGMGVRTTHRLGVTWTVLVVMQVALSTAVLPRAAELIWGQLHPNFTAREFAAEEFVTARIKSEDEGVRLRDVRAELARRVKDGIGASGAAISAGVDGIHEDFARVETDLGGQEPFRVASNYVDDAYFDVFQASLLAGRAFEAADFNSGQNAVIVNRTFADQFPLQNPLGLRLRYHGDPYDRASGVERWYEIVGLVDEISVNTPRPRVYHALLPEQTRQVSLTVRVGPTVPSDLTRRLMRITTSVDPNLQVEELRTLDDMYQSELMQDNFMGFTMAGIVLVVLLFAAAGVHTLVTFAVAQRRIEIGIRSALGAPPLRLVADVFRRDLSPVVAGAVIGILLAFPLDKLILRENNASIPMWAVSGAFAFMVAMGLLAVAGPARRLLRMDSTEALRDS